MAGTLVIAEGMWRDLRDHLLADGDEHVAFLLARTAGERLLARDAILVPDQDLEARGRAVSLNLPALLGVMNAAARRGLALVEAHSHPLSAGEVRFSPTDEQGQAEMAAYLSGVIPGRPYGALVFGRNAVRGTIWRDGAPAPLASITVHGGVLERWRGDGSPARVAAAEGHERHDRQVLAFGEAGHARIAAARVAVVGLGGIGSIVSLELAHLGVRDLTLIDDDAVEESNLNRLAGAAEADAGRPKVEVATEYARRTNPAVRVTALRANIRDRRALAAAASADVLFGCVDSDSGRLILNDLAVSHLLPYVDCGVGITASGGGIAEAGGRVVVWTPGRPCLLCCREIDLAAAAGELESPEEREFRQRRGYVGGVDVPAPAVISLNGAVASMAVTEFLALVAGFRAPGHYTYYDMLDRRASPRLVRPAPGCVACALEGAGDEAGLERYGRRGLPTDLPRPG